jgi:hypothetical protein
MKVKPSTAAWGGASVGESCRRGEGLERRQRMAAAKRAGDALRGPWEVSAAHGTAATDLRRRAGRTAVGEGAARWRRVEARAGGRGKKKGLGFGMHI